MTVFCGCCGDQSPSPPPANARTRAPQARRLLDPSSTQEIQDGYASHSSDEFSVIQRIFDGSSPEPGYQMTPITLLNPEESIKSPKEKVNHRKSAHKIRELNSKVRKRLSRDSEISKKSAKAKAAGKRGKNVGIIAGTQGPKPGRLRKEEILSDVSAELGGYDNDAEFIPTPVEALSLMGSTRLNTGVASLRMPNTAFIPPRLTSRTFSSQATAVDPLCNEQLSPAILPEPARFSSTPPMDFYRLPSISRVSQQGEWKLSLEESRLQGTSLSKDAHKLEGDIEDVHELARVTGFEDVRSSQAETIVHSRGHAATSSVHLYNMRISQRLASQSSLMSDQFRNLSDSDHCERDGSIRKSSVQSFLQLAGENAGYVRRKVSELNKLECGPGPHHPQITRSNSLTSSVKSWSSRLLMTLSARANDEPVFKENSNIFADPQARTDDGVLLDSARSSEESGAKVSVPETPLLEKSSENTRTSSPVTVVHQSPKKPGSKPGSLTIEADKAEPKKKARKSLFKEEFGSLFRSQRSKTNQKRGNESKGIRTGSKPLPIFDGIDKRPILRKEQHSSLGQMILEDQRQVRNRKASEEVSTVKIGEEVTGIEASEETSSFKESVAEDLASEELAGDQVQAMESVIKANAPSSFPLPESKSFTPPTPSPLALSTCPSPVPSRVLGGTRVLGELRNPAGLGLLDEEALRNSTVELYKSMEQQEISERERALKTAEAIWRDAVNDD
ncbi:MAG: hypothetical protein M1819_005038 [Sarea resinae]|nr:MAG: hypothetical protein M1819_005038 [Sarea resinae]